MVVAKENLNFLVILLGFSILLLLT